jgi:hypothetical protein
MSTMEKKTSRRAFVLSGGATLGAGVAAAAGAAALPAADAAHPAEREAIRKVHAEFIAGVERGTQAGAVPTHRAYRSNARQNADVLAITANGREASATWNVDVQVATPLEGNSTLVQMARLQGMHATLHWEAGRLAARYERSRGVWKLAEVAYTAA